MLLPQLPIRLYDENMLAWETKPQQFRKMGGEPFFLNSSFGLRPCGTTASRPCEGVTSQANPLETGAATSIKGYARRLPFLFSLNQSMKLCSSGRPHGHGARCDPEPLAKVADLERCLACHCTAPLLGGPREVTQVITGVAEASRLLFAPGWWGSLRRGALHRVTP